jgi:hypothetical protein
MSCTNTSSCCCTKCCQGERGVAGPRGGRGPQGEVGPQGPQGLQGPQGDTGVILLHADHPKSISAGSSIQSIGSYELLDFSAIPSGTTFEMEFDVRSFGIGTGTGLLTFLLDESNIYIPELDIFSNPAIELEESEYEAFNFKLTLTKNTNTEGYISLVATRVPNAESNAPTLIHAVSKFIPLISTPGVEEVIEVIVKPNINRIFLDRVIIKYLLPN